MNRQLIQFYILTLILSLNTSLFAQNTKRYPKGYKPSSSKVAAEKSKAETEKAKALEESRKKMAEKSKAKFEKSNTTSSNNSSVSSSDKSKLFTQVDFSGSPTLKINGATSATVSGSIAAGFQATPNLSIGLFGSTNLYTSQKGEVYNVTDISKVIEVNTFRQSTVGLTIGFTINPKSVIQFTPEIRGGYSFMNIQGVDFATDQKSFIEYHYVNINPRLNIGFKVSDYATFGINGGYQIPHFVKGTALSIYEAQHPTAGLFFRFQLPKY
jgi:hypothetical protein